MTPIKVQANLILRGVTNREAVAVVIAEPGGANRRYTVTIKHGSQSSVAVVRGTAKDGGSSAVAWFDFPVAPAEIDAVTVLSEREEIFQ